MRRRNGLIDVSLKCLSRFRHTHPRCGLQDPIDPVGIDLGSRNAQDCNVLPMDAKTRWSARISGPPGKVRNDDLRLPV